MDDESRSVGPEDQAGSDSSIIGQGESSDLSGNLLGNFSASVQVAQATGSAGGTAIGQVTASEGSVIALRVDGSQAELSEDDPVFQGDTLVTDTEGSVSLVFLDGTTFDLGGDATIVLDELIYNPSDGSGSLLTSVVKGTFVFLTGTIAGSGEDAMQVKTPSGTIGIRGTQVACAIESRAAQACTLFADPDGSLGVVAFTHSQGVVLLTDEFSSVFSAGGTIITRVLSREEAEAIYADVLENVTQETEAGPLETQGGVVLTSGGIFIPPDLRDILGLLAESDVIGGVPSTSITLLEFNDIFLEFAQASLATVTVDEESQSDGGVTITGSINYPGAGVSFSVVGFGLSADGASPGDILTSGGVPVELETSDDGMSLFARLPASSGGSPDDRLVFEFHLNSGGDFEFTLYRVLDHFVVDAFGPNDTIQLDVSVLINDPNFPLDMDLVGNVTVVIEDSHPQAIDDPVPVVVEGELVDVIPGEGEDLQPLSILGNVISNDIQGADNQLTLISFSYAGGTAAVAADDPDGTTVTTDNGGTLQVFANGTFIYTRPDNVAGDVDDGFTYTIADFDGDTSTARQSIIVEEDPTSTSISTSPITDDLESRLPGGSNPSDSGVVILLQDLAGIDFGADQDLIFVQSLDLVVLDNNGEPVPLDSLTSGGYDLAFETVEGSLTLSATVQGGPNDGQLAFRMLVDEDGVEAIQDAEGAEVNVVGPFFHFQLFLPLDHFNVGATGTDDPLTLQFVYVISDGIDVSPPGIISITLFDDGPVAIVNADNMVLESAVPGLGTDDSNPDDAQATGFLQFSQGADGAVITGFTIDGVVAAFNGDTGLYEVIGSHFIMTVNPATNEYIYTLTGPAPHSGDEGESFFHNITYTVTDGDLDTAVGALRIQVFDDNPVLRAVANSAVDEDDLSTSLTNSDDGTSPSGGAVSTGAVALVFDFGTDGPAVADAGGAHGEGIVLVTLDSAVTASDDPVSLSYDSVSDQWVGSVGGSDARDIFTLSFDIDAGTYEFVLLDNIDFPSADDLEAAQTLNFTVTAEDNDGDQLAQAISIDVTDDVPIPVADTNSVTADDEGAPVANLTGNVVDGDAFGGMADDLGADGYGSIFWTGQVASEGTVTVTGLYGTLTVFADGSYIYDLDEGNAAVLALQDGNAPLTDTFGYDVTDGDGDTRSSQLAITISGANEAPIITAGTDSGMVTEDDTPPATLSVIGSFDFGDLDVTDTHTATMPQFLSSTNPGGGELGNLSTLVTTQTTGGTGGVLQWTYTVDNSLTQFLGANDTVVERYEIGVSDGQGGFDTVEIEVTVQGNNDEPIITTAVLTGAVTEDESDPTLTTSGTVDFGDVDLSDSHTATMPVFLSSTNPGGTALGGMTASITTQTDGTGTGGVLTWTYTVADSATQFLGVGDTVVEQFTVEVDDGFGGTDSRTVMVTIHGTNDGPTITGGQTSDSVTEDSDPTSLVASGNLNFSDIDLTDNHIETAPVFLSSTNPNGGTALGGLVTLITSQTDGTGTGGVLQWTYTVDNDAVQFLGAGETVVETYEVGINDGEIGGIDTVTITVTINGTNDQPEITLSEPTIRISEEGLMDGLTDEDSAVGSDDQTDDVSETSTASETDADTTDMHSYSLGTPLTALTSGGVAVVWTGAPGTTVTGEVGGVAVITLTVDALSGLVTATIDGPIDHLGDGEDQLSVVVPVIVTDDSGAANNSDTTNLTIIIEDDQLEVAADTDVATEGGAPIGGNILTGAGSDGDAAGMDQSGADGFGVIRSVTIDGTTYTLNDAGLDVIGGGSFDAASGELTVVTALGGTFVIVMNEVVGGDPLGTYSYAPPTDGNGQGGNIETISYVAEDGDGDQDGADLVITVNPIALAPTVTVSIPSDQSLVITEDSNGSFDLTATANGDDAVSQVTIKGLDALFDAGWTYTLTGATSSFSVSSSGDDVVLDLDSAQAAFSVTLTLFPPMDDDRDVATVLGGSDLAVTAIAVDGTATSAPATDAVVDVNVDAVADDVSITITVTDSDDDDDAFQQDEVGTVTVTATFLDVVDGSEAHRIMVTVPEGFVYDSSTFVLPDGVTVFSDNGSEIVFAVTGLTSVALSFEVVNENTEPGDVTFTAVATADETVPHSGETDQNNNNNAATSNDTNIVVIDPVFPSGLAYTVAGGSGGGGGGASAFLYAVDLESGVTEQVGLVEINGSSNLSINGLALNPLDGFLYGFGGQGGNQAFIRINPTSGETTVIGPTDNFYAQTGGLSFTTAGVLWASVGNQISTIDITTGLFDFSAAFTLPSNQTTDAFAVTPDGTTGFYIVGTDFYMINLADGTTTLIGQVSDAETGTAYDIDGLSFDDNGVLYGADNSGVIVRLDPETALGVNISTIANNQVTNSGLSTLAISGINPGTYVSISNALDDDFKYIDAEGGVLADSLLGGTVDLLRDGDGGVTVSQPGTNSDVNSVYIQNDDDLDLIVDGIADVNVRLGGGINESSISVSGASSGELEIGVLEQEGAFFEIGESDDLIDLDAVGDAGGSVSFVLRSGAGDDVIEVSGDASVTGGSIQVFGGSGEDSVTVSGIDGGLITYNGVENITLDGAEANSLSLSAADVLDSEGGLTILVSGTASADDVVTLIDDDGAGGSAWTNEGSADGVTTYTYSTADGVASVKIDDDLVPFVVS